MNSSPVELGTIGNVDGADAGVGAGAAKFNDFAASAPHAIADSARPTAPAAPRATSATCRGSKTAEEGWFGAGVTRIRSNILPPLLRSALKSSHPFRRGRQTPTHTRRNSGARESPSA